MSSRSYAGAAADGGRGLGSVIGVVSLGGLLGSLARYGIGQVWPSPWGIVTINIVGSLSLGLLMGALQRTNRHPLIRPFIGIGVLGGFTTFSTAMVDLRAEMQLGQWVSVLGLLLVTVVGSVLAAGAGWRWAGRISSRRPGTAR